eukprot:Polyplicarium_translucidae@DN3121_c0_g1_i13.p1
MGKKRKVETTDAVVPTPRKKFAGFTETLRNLETSPLTVFQVDTTPGAGEGAGEDAEKRAFDLQSSHFSEALRMFTSTYRTADFQECAREIRPLSQSLPMILVNRRKIAEAILSTIEASREEDDNLGARRATADGLLKLLAVLAKDLMDEAADVLPIIFGSMVSKFDLTDQDILASVFGTLAFIFRNLHKVVCRALPEVLSQFSPWLGHSRPHVRQFSSEAFAWLLRRTPLEEEECADGDTSFQDSIGSTIQTIAEIAQAELAASQEASVWSECLGVILLDSVKSVDGKFTRKFQPFLEYVFDFAALEDFFQRGVLHVGPVQSPAVLIRGLRSASTVIEEFLPAHWDAISMIARIVKIVTQRARPHKNTSDGADEQGALVGILELLTKAVCGGIMHNWPPSNVSQLEDALSGLACLWKILSACSSLRQTGESREAVLAAVGARVAALTAGDSAGGLLDFAGTWCAFLHGALDLFEEHQQIWDIACSVAFKIPKGSPAFGVCSFILSRTCAKFCVPAKAVNRFASSVLEGIKVAFADDPPQGVALCSVVTALFQAHPLALRKLDRNLEECFEAIAEKLLTTDRPHIALLGLRQLAPPYLANDPRRRSHLAMVSLDAIGRLKAQQAQLSLGLASLEPSAHESRAMAFDTALQLLSTCVSGTDGGPDIPTEPLAQAALLGLEAENSHTRAAAAALLRRLPARALVSAIPCEETHGESEAALGARLIELVHFIETTPADIDSERPKVQAFKELAEAVLRNRGRGLPALAQMAAVKTLVSQLHVKFFPLWKASVDVLALLQADCQIR